jgi:phasin family protein
MAVEKFPFAFDAEKVKEMFKGMKMPMVDMEAVMAAHQKNVDAMVEANKVMFAGYQAVAKRQAALVEAALAETKDKFSELQGQPLTADQATKNAEAVKVAFEKSIADIRELAEMAQKANTGAFDVVKARIDEAMAEFKAAADKLAA